MPRTTTMTIRLDIALSDFVAANVGEDGAYENVSEYIRDLIRRDKERAENQAFDRGDMPAAVADPLVALLGDLLATEHLQESQEFARLVQHGIATQADRSRGVKQAPFVVLLGVQMPAALVEIGFVTNPSEEKRLTSDGERDRLTREIAEAVTAFRDRYDARRGLVRQGGDSEAH